MQDKIIVVSEQALENTLSRVLKEHLKFLSAQDHKQASSEDSILTRNQAAEFLQISLPTLHAWTQSKEIPSTRIGGRIYYSKQELIKKIRNYD